MTVAAAERVLGPVPRRWTMDEYYRLAEQGYFQGQRVQLIDGEIIEMAPQGDGHIHSFLVVQRVLRKIFDPDCIRQQLPLRVSQTSEPEPDLAITARPFDQAGDRPTTAALVIEIADSSIYLDRRKAGLYAQAGVPDYWILNIEKRRVEVYRRPVADSQSELGYRYDERFELDENGVIVPVAAPDAKVQVKSLF
jgi:Uma2 family endonuclease